MNANAGQDKGEIKKKTKSAIMDRPIVTDTRSQILYDIGTDIKSKLSLVIFMVVSAWHILASQLLITFVVHILLVVYFVKAPC